MHLISNQRGIALITVVLVALAVSSMAIAASMLTLNGTLIRRYSERATIADHAAVSGLQEGLSAVLGNDSLYPATGFTTLEDSVQVMDALGRPIPGMRRSTWVGPSSNPSRGSIVSMAYGQGGVRSLRRVEIAAETFASYGMVVGNDPFSIGFGPEDDQSGPVHFNSDIVFHAPAGGDTAIFYRDVSSSGDLLGSANADFRGSHLSSQATVTIPNASSLSSFASLANAGNLYISGDYAGGSNSATTRIEFLAIDMVDGDESTLPNDMEGFFRVFQSLGSPAGARYVTAEVDSATGFITTTANCGVLEGNGIYRQMSTLATPDSAFSRNFIRCFLGGDPRLRDPPEDSSWAASPDPYGGSWVAYPGSSVSVPGTAGDSHLWPYTSAVNPNAKGVIYVSGDVALSGRVVGGVTVVSNDDIIIVDDLVQVADSANACGGALGLIAADDVVLKDNTLNTPQRTSGIADYRTLSSTADEYVEAAILALSSFRVQNTGFGPVAGDNGGLGAEPCEGQPWGRGCLYLTGSLAMQDRELITSGTAGHKMRFNYDACLATNPPPHFPTTGDFEVGRSYTMDPANFDPATWFAAYQN